MQTGAATPPGGEGCAPSSGGMGLGFGCNGDPPRPADGRLEHQVPLPRDSGGGGAPLCGTADEGGTVEIDCGPGQLIRTIVFASYGTPEGSCGSFSLGSCHASSSIALVGTACLHQQRCSVPATNTIFGDPCAGAGKRLYVAVRCGVAVGALEPQAPPWPLAPLGHGATQAALLFVIAICAARRRTS